jgi:hypothetical protein
MAVFDFIAAPELRQSLEDDYAEMQRSLGAENWKSAQVMAGSIVEAILVDYLLATPGVSRPKKDPLRYELGEAISVCLSEGAITQRTADLCSVIRYRNLIHPGRVVRTGEAPPTENSAKIADSVVQLIVEDVSENRRVTVGLTAEQIVSKIERDPGVLPILKHLLEDASSQERERLVISEIPTEYLRLMFSMDDPAGLDAKLQRLSKAYRVTLEELDENARSRSAEQFVKVLREADGETVSMYSDRLFEIEDMEHLDKAHIEMVKNHLISRIPNVHTEESLKNIRGLGAYIHPEDVENWIDPLVRAVIASTATRALQTAAREFLVDYEYMVTPAVVDSAIEKRLTTWADFLKSRDNDEAAQRVITLLSDFRSNLLDPVAIPEDDDDGD